MKQRLRDQKQRKVGQNFARIGAWNQESEKLETSLVPRDTLCVKHRRSRLKVVITSLFGLHAVVIQ